MLIVRSTRNCPNVPRALMALEELGVAYQTETEADGWFREHVGVAGPILEDGALVVVEINAVLRHVARRYGLLPDGLAAQAEMDRWLEMVRRISETLWPTPRADAARHLLGFLESRLADRAWLCGPFSIVDCSYLATALPPTAARVPLDGLPRVADFLERVRTRPSAVRAVERTPR